MPALEAFWSAVLEEGMLHERWYPTNLFIPGRGDVQVPRAGRALHALGVRRLEPGFIGKLAALHATKLDGPLEALLELPPTVPDRVEQVIALLRRTLSLSAPLKHLGALGLALPPAGSPFTLVEHHHASTNGAGKLTSLSEWRLELRAPIRLRVTVHSSGEEGAAPAWTVKLIAPLAAPLEPLLDAFREEDLSFLVERVAALAD